VACLISIRWRRAGEGRYAAVYLAWQHGSRSSGLIVVAGYAAAAAIPPLTSCGMHRSGRL